MVNYKPMVVFIVASSDLVHRVYSRYELADVHAKCITGCKVVPAEICDELPPEIRADVESDMNYDFDEDTPVIDTHDFDKIVVDVDDIE